MTHQSDGRWRGKTTSLMTSAPRSRIVLPSFVQIIPITTLLPLCTFWFIIVMYIAFGASTFNDLANRDLKWYNDTMTPFCKIFSLFLFVKPCKETKHNNPVAVLCYQKIFEHKYKWQRWLVMCIISGAIHQRFPRHRQIICERFQTVVMYLNSMYQCIAARSFA